MAQVLLSKAEFARLAGVSKPAVTKAVAGALGAAVVNGEIDSHHPAAVAYLRAKGKQPPHAGAPTSSPPRARSSGAAPPAHRRARPRADEEDEADRRRDDGHPPNLKGSEDLALALGVGDESDRWGDLTLREIAARFGTFKTFAGVLDALKTIEDIRKTRLHNEETEGALISRDLVATSIIGLLDGMTRRLLTDAPKTIARKTYAQHEAGEPVEAAEATVRDAIESQIRPAKASTERVLRNA